MNKRPPMEIDSEIHICFGQEKKTFRIEELVSEEGASCLVYRVSYQYRDNQGQEMERQMILKEFYPISQPAERKGGKLCFANVENQEEYQRLAGHFREGYARLHQFSNEKSTVNCTVKPELEGFAEDNGTMYILQEWNNGNAFCLEESTLQETIKVLYMTVQALEKYHEQGYLHLDLKPENILWLKNESKEGYIKLFDCDTVISKEELKQIGYPLRSSREYMAPELERVMGYGPITGIHKIQERTDYYAIGAMLFHKVTGKHVQKGVTWEDSYEDWYSEIREATCLNTLDPAIKRKLAEFFLKTMHHISSRRYGTAKELQNALGRLERLADPYRMYLRSSRFSSGEIFLGREEELRQMEEILAENQSVVLQGIGGIGKSVLARAYAERHEKEYDVVITADYVSNLKDIIEKAYDENVLKKERNGINEHKTEYIEKNRCLKEMCDQNKVLIIVDNFDVETDLHMKNFLEIKWDIIFTTRCLLCGFGKRIEVNALEEIEKMFKMYYLMTCKKNGMFFSELENEIIKKILSFVGNHTIAVELLAKTAGYYKLDMHELWDEFKDGIELYPYQQVAYTKDEQVEMKNVYDALGELFNIISNKKEKGYLSKEEIDILRAISLLGMPISEKKLFKIMQIEPKRYRGILFSLNKKGWIERLQENNDELYTWPTPKFLKDDGVIYDMHPVIKEVLFSKLCGNNFVEKCEVIVNNMKQTVLHILACSFCDQPIISKKWILIYSNFIKKIMNCIEDEKLYELEWYEISGLWYYSIYDNLKSKYYFQKELELCNILEKNTREKEVIINSNIVNTDKQNNISEKINADIEAAQYGYVYALLRLGMRYYYGIDIEQDKKKGFEFYLKAAVQGNAVAQYNIGKAYLYGDNSEENMFEAIKWLKKAEKGGCIWSREELSWLYEKMATYRVEIKDYKKAIKYYILANGYKNADNRNNSELMYKIGLLYSKERNIEKNREKAFYYYDRAMEGGDNSAGYEVAYMYFNGIGIDKNRQRAIEIYEKLARKEERHPRILCQYIMGYLHFYGIGVRKSRKKAIFWYSKVAEEGYSEAFYELGNIYYSDWKGKRNKEQILYFYNKAIEGEWLFFQYFVNCLEEHFRNNMDRETALKILIQTNQEYRNVLIQYDLGCIYEEMSGDYQKKAFEIMKCLAKNTIHSSNTTIDKYKEYGREILCQKADKGDDNAMLRIGIIYFYGIGVSKNFSEAFKWFEKASEKGNILGKYNVAVCYEKGMGIQANSQIAYKIYKEIAEVCHTNTKKRYDNFIRCIVI